MRLEKLESITWVNNLKALTLKTKRRRWLREIVLETFMNIGTIGGGGGMKGGAAGLIGLNTHMTITYWILITYFIKKYSYLNPQKLSALFPLLMSSFYA